jgi:hypothetical protein
MKTVGQVLEERKDVQRFTSALSKDWQSVLFLAIHKLHAIGQDGHADTSSAKQTLLQVVKSRDDSMLNKGIEEVQALADAAPSPLILGLFREVLDCLFAVKISPAEAP